MIFLIVKHYEVNNDRGTSSKGNTDLWAKMIHQASEVMTYKGNYGTGQSLLG